MLLREIAAAVLDTQFRTLPEQAVQGIRGYRSHEDTLHLPLFPNSQDINGLAEHVSALLAVEPAPFGFVLGGHGLYAWGETMREARRIRQLATQV